MEMEKEKKVEVVKVEEEKVEEGVGEEEERGIAGAGG